MKDSNVNFVFLVKVILYDIAAITAGVLFLPWYLLKKKRIYPLRERLWSPCRLHQRRSLWIHCVSVGEVILIQELLRALRAEYPQYDIVISTITPAGYSVARKEYGPAAEIIFLPLDISISIRRVLERINPVLFIAVETELWPQLYRLLSGASVPAVILNARVSPAAYARYQLIKPLLKGLFKRVRCIAAQNQQYCQRFIDLGAPRDHVCVGGNLKFENIQNADTEKLQRARHELSARLAKKGKDFVIVAGSTHQPEEDILLQCYQRLLTAYPYVRLVLCPRHPERAEKIVQSAQRLRLSVSRLSSDTPVLDSNVIVADRMGILFALYSFADIAYVGGSLAPIGGHNILEPAYFHKPIVFGPSMFNFEDMRDIFLERRAAIQVHGAEELYLCLNDLITDELARGTLQNNVRSLFDAEQSIVQKNMELIRKCLV